MATLPRPPAVSQIWALNPDGTPDEAASADCGEACLSSIFTALTGYRLSPGCVRQSLGPAAVHGFTDPIELCGWAASVWGQARVLVLDAVSGWQYAHRLRKTGAYLVALGHWIEPASLHWLLLYEGSGSVVWAMDPWTGTHIAVDRVRFRDQFVGQAVWVRPRVDHRQ
jgi:ABC-type bacteriocin/lantibiotic exporter with double-glycine peptidase domain